METIDFLNSRIDEENMDVQEMYFHMLDKIIDATILLQYKKISLLIEYYNNCLSWERKNEGKWKFRCRKKCIICNRL